MLTQVPARVAGVTLTLTKEDVSYLRRADDIYGINILGQNYLRCVKRGDSRDRFDGDVTVDIPVEGNGADTWFTSMWQYPWETLRVGDKVRLHWYPDAATNETMREVGLHGDTLYVDITRGKQKPARYVAAMSVTPDNTARMCRGATSRGREWELR